jgi:mRNA interferase MazF
MGKNKNIAPLRGEVFLVDFDPTVGHEIQKIRPALILQNDIENQFSSLTIAAPITSSLQIKLSPTRILVPEYDGGLHKRSIVLVNQLRSVDKQRLLKRIGIMSPQTMESVDFAIRVSLGLIAI